MFLFGFLIFYSVKKFVLFLIMFCWNFVVTCYFVGVENIEGFDQGLYHKIDVCEGVDDADIF